MDYSFPRYLLSKRTVDDRALNRHVYAALQANLPDRLLRVVEVGAGIGVMPARLLEWGLLQQAEYLAVDEQVENIEYALDWLPRWAAQNGLGAERSGPGRLRLFDAGRRVRLEFLAADVFDFVESAPACSDLLIAHAFLDLLPLPEALPRLFSLLEPGGLAWLTINFDGLTCFEPPLDPGLDSDLERLYHQTMDERLTNGARSGDSRTGRRLFGYLEGAGARIVSAGASDWVVHPIEGRYPADEAYFLQFILYFFESSLTGHPDLDPGQFARWLAARRRQVERGELVYVAHQLDFLVRV